MGVVFFGLADDGDSFVVIGRVEDGKIVDDTDGELKETLDGMALQDGYLSAKFNNHFLNAALTKDVWEKESGRMYVDHPVDAPEGVEVQDSEHGAPYYIPEEEQEEQ